MAETDHKPNWPNTPGLTVINAGLFKTGTASMAEAYRILGLRPHHGLDLMDLPEHWAVLERAAEATWPDAPGVRHPQQQQQLLTRADWDAIFGPYDAVTDVASLFAEQLYAAYPEAKVVIVKRDVEKWLTSFDSQIVAPVWSPLGTFLQHGMCRLLGIRAIDAVKKMCYGFFCATSADEIRRNARGGYERYYDRIREVVPEENRLEYKLGDGWAPLCAFLGKEVPDVEFPRLNGKDEHTAKQQEQVYDIYRKTGKLLAPFAGAAAVGGVAWLLARRSGVL